MLKKKPQCENTGAFIYNDILLDFNDFSTSLEFFGIQAI